MIRERLWGRQYGVRREHGLRVVEDKGDEAGLVQIFEPDGSTVDQEHRVVSSDARPEAAAKGEMEAVPDPACLPFV